MKVKLDKKIKIQELNSIHNTNNFQEEKWIDIKTCYASVNNLYGKEFWSAKAIQSENTVEFIIRYSKSLEVLMAADGTKKYRIFYNNRAYDIVFADNIKYSNLWIKLKAIGGKHE